MRTIFILLKKEFLQIFRNRSMLPIIFVMPIIQLLILSHAASFEVKNIQVHVMDYDQGFASRLLVQKFKAFRYFHISGTSFSDDEAMTEMAHDQARIILKIPKGFEQDLAKKNSAHVQIIINSIDGAAAGVAGVYAGSVLADFNREMAVEWVNNQIPEQYSTIHVTHSFWYNPEMNYKTFMVPGILVLLVTMIGMFLAGMNIVREKELGTIEQLNVTPIQKHQFIIGKLLPFWLIALFELAFGLTIGKIAFDIPMIGNLGVVFLFAGVYLLVILGLGLFVSTFTDTQQQAMFISWFIMVLFILMSGLFTPIESMPEWARLITRFNPVAYFVEVMRMVLLKGAGLNEIRWHFLVLVTYATAILSLATWKYKKVS